MVTARFKDERHVLRDIEAKPGFSDYPPKLLFFMERGEGFNAENPGLNRKARKLPEFRKH